jgi:hypothetical protein
VVYGLPSLAYICQMISIVYPAPAFKMKKENGSEFIFDAIRKQWIVLTEEEWVRQNFIQYLLQELKCQQSLIAIEKEITVGELKKRFDIVIYNRQHQPWMLIECKASVVSLDASVFEQLLRYHISVPVDFLVITNGHYTMGWQKINGQLKELDQLPVWE